MKTDISIEQDSQNSNEMISLDEFAGDLSAKLRLLELCRSIHGRRAASRLWDRLNMPAVSFCDVARRAGAVPNGDQPVLDRFLTECCIESPGSRIQSSVLYREFSGWCRRQSDIHPMSQRSFSLQMKDAGIQIKRSNSAWFVGLKLRGKA